MPGRRICLSVCLPLRAHAYLRNYASKLHQILCACCLWP